MKFRNIFWGIILILIGVLFTLENLNVIDFDWYNLWRLWPVVLVLWGVSILPVKNLFKVALVVLVLLASVFYMLDQTVEWRNEDYSITYYEDERPVNQDFTIPYEDSIQFASLDMEVAASKFVLVDESFDLIDFEKKGTVIDYKYTVKQTDTSADINIYIDDEVVLKTKSHNRIDMSLNPQPTWDLFFEVGAADVTFDLSGLKVNDLDIDAGAAAIDIKLGDDNPETNVSIETGASSIKVKIPKESGCDLNISSVLSGKSISGFDKIDHGHYQTDNFHEAENKIYLVVETAVSSYSIIRY